MNTFLTVFNIAVVVAGIILLVKIIRKRKQEEGGE